jgi:DICT domain-containing protein
VLLTTFQHGRHFDDNTRRRYNRLAAHAILTATFADGMPLEPGPRIRGCPLVPEDPLIGEWNVIVIGSQFTGALFARERHDGVADSDRTFELIVSYDRDLILDAARPLLERLLPIR